MESTAIDALAGVDYYTDKTGDTLEKLNEIKYDSVGEALTGIWRKVEGNLLIPLEQKAMPVINDFINNVSTGFDALVQLFKGDDIGFAKTVTEAFGQEQGLKVMKFFYAVKDGFDQAKGYAQTFKQYLEGVFALFSGNEGKAVSLLTRLGLSPEQIAQLITTIQKIKSFANTMFDVFNKAMSGIRTAAKAAFDFLLPFIMPIINKIVSFVGEQLAVMSKFWDENGAQITQAVKNAFNIIKGVIDFIMPAILFIIDMVWGNIKGVIKGALNIIMGAIKIFAGLFTGDIKKMWEGVKQLFKGAIEFVWNLINLLMVGRILKGIASFIKLGVAAFKSFWTKTVNIFKNLDKSVGSVVDKMVGFLKNSWTKAKDEAVSIFTNIKNAIKGTFDDIISGAKALPGKIGNGIKNMAGKAVDGAIDMANRVLRGWGKGANAIIGGINWVLGKIGVDSKIPKWDVPQYAKGTGDKGHPGGLAIVGEQGRELAWIPGVGPMMIGVKGEEMLNLPKGTSVLPNKETENLVSAGMIPGYASGVGNFLKDAGSKAWGAVKKGAAGMGDFFSGLASGAKSLISKVWDNFLEFPKMSGVAKDMAHGAIKKAKSSATEFLQKKIEGFMSSGGGGGVGWGSPFVRTSRFNPGGRVHPITGQVRAHNGDDWAAPMGTPIPAQGGGVVTYSGWMNGYGNIVITRAGDIERRYGHNSRNLVQVGQSVKPGQIIALVGSTGDSTGPHSHYEVRKNGYPVNPSGYKVGGFINKEHMAMVGEGDKEEVVIPLENYRDRAIGLWKRAGEKLGVSSDSMAILYNEQEKVVNFLKNLIGEAKTQIQEITKQSPLLQQINDSIHTAKDLTKQAITDVKTGLSTQLDESDQSTLSKIASTAKETASVVVSTVKATEARLASVVNNVGSKVAQATQTAISKVQSVATASAKKATSTLSPIQRKVNDLIKKGGSAASKYFAVIKEDGDWMNDWATHIGGTKTRKPYMLAGYELARSLGFSLGKYASQNLARVKAYAQGGVAAFPQLAMLAEGGYSESIISHDPAFKNRSREIWSKTGNMLGFSDEKGTLNNQAVIDRMDKILFAIERGHEITIDGKKLVGATKETFNKTAKTDAYFEQRHLGRSRI